MLNHCKQKRLLLYKNITFFPQKQAVLSGNTRRGFPLRNITYNSARSIVPSWGQHRVFFIMTAQSVFLPDVPN